MSREMSSTSPSCFVPGRFSFNIWYLQRTTPLRYIFPILEMFFEKKKSEGKFILCGKCSLKRLQPAQFEPHFLQTPHLYIAFCFHQSGYFVCSLNIEFSKGTFSLPSTVHNYKKTRKAKQKKKNKEARSTKCFARSHQFWFSHAQPWNLPLTYSIRRLHGASILNVATVNAII